MRRFLLVAVFSACPLLALGEPTAAQVAICSSSGFPSVAGTTACDGASRPLVVTANVRTYAKLALEEIFGSPAASLDVAMGDVDANCVTAPASGVTCASDAASGSATWFGDVQFRVKLSGLGASRAKLTGTRPTSGTMPSGRLLDGAAGTAPLTPYPIAPAPAAELVRGLGAGETVVARSLGVKVVTADPASTWSTSTVYTLVLE
jgi:hypothetical protein